MVRWRIGDLNDRLVSTLEVDQEFVARIEHHVRHDSFRQHQLHCARVAQLAYILLDPARDPSVALG